MRILNIDTYLLEVPLKTPFVTALRRVDSVQDLVVRIELENGLCGYGEAAPTLVISGDSLQSMQAVIHTVFKPMLVGQSIFNFQSLLHQLQRRVVGNSSAKAAVRGQRAQYVMVPTFYRCMAPSEPFSLHPRRADAGCERSLPSGTWGSIIA